MNIYLAAPWSHRHKARQVAQQLRDAGHDLVSRWHDVWALTDTDDPLMLEQEAAMDLQDVEDSDIVVVLNIEKSEGKAVEQGYALGLGIPILIVGLPRGNVFQWLPEMHVVADLPNAFAYLASF